jgi:hypothetical protein
MNSLMKKGMTVILGLGLLLGLSLFTYGAAAQTTTPPTTPTPTTPVEGPKLCADYKDVNEVDPNCDTYKYLKEAKIITGYADGTLRPNDQLKRNEMTKILLEASGNFDTNADYCKGKNPFPDVTKNDWAYQYVCRGKELGMITGYKAGKDKGKFKSTNSMNRAEFLALFARITKKEMPTEGDLYEDVGPKTWFSSYARFAKKNNLYSGTHFYPNTPVSRSEGGYVLHHLHNLGMIR